MSFLSLSLSRKIDLLRTHTHTHFQGHCSLVDCALTLPGALTHTVPAHIYAACGAAVPAGTKPNPLPRVRARACARTPVNYSTSNAPSFKLEQSVGARGVVHLIKR